MTDDSVQLVACIPRLRRYARTLTGNLAAAEDLVQGTMERGWFKLPSWKKGSNMRAWLFSIMHNIYVDQSRKAPAPIEYLDDDLHVLSTASTQFEHVDMMSLEAALCQLTIEQREVILLVALEEMSYDEISVTLKIPLGTVMSRLSRDRERIRAIMEGRPVESSLKVIK